MSTASTTRAEPDANNRRASSSTALGVVRSPMPTSTTPSRQDVHVAALERGRPVVGVVVAPVALEVGVAEQRVVAVDGAGVQRLALTSELGHRVDGHAVADPCRVVALEQRVRQRMDDEVVVREALPPQPAGTHGAEVGLEHAADQRPRERVRRRDRRGKPRTVRASCSPNRSGVQVRSSTNSRPSGVPTAPASRSPNRWTVAPRERSVSVNASCSSRARAGPRDVVEQQAVDVAGRQPVELAPGPVRDHVPQRADLGIDARLHAPSMAACAGRWGAGAGQKWCSCGPPQLRTRPCGDRPVPPDGLEPSLKPF